MKITLCAPVDIHWLARFSGVDATHLAEGYGSTATTPLVIELLRRGHEVTIYTLSHSLPVELSLKWGNLRLFVGSGRQYGAIRNLFKPEIAYLERVIRQDRPAFVNAHWTYEFGMAALRSGVPTVVTIHDLPWNVLRYFRDRYRFGRLLMAYMVAARATRYTAVSHDAARHFARFMRPGAKIRTIPNFLNDAVLDKSTGPREHPAGPLVYASVLQGWTRRKNPKASLRAFSLLRQRVAGVRLLMIGADYEMDGPAARWAAEQGLADDVTFVGALAYRVMLDRLQSSVDVLVMPSLDEALSMTILENMALGIPVIGGRSTPGVPEELEDGAAGLLVDMTQPEKIAKAMLRLQNDPAEFARISRAAFSRAHAVYTAESVVSQYVEVYRELLYEAHGTPILDREKEEWPC